MEGHGEAARVCPRCGTRAGEAEYCETSGLHLWAQTELPTRSDWETQQTPSRLSTNEPLRDAAGRALARWRGFSPRVQLGLAAAVVALIAVTAIVLTRENESGIPLDARVESSLEHAAARDLRSEGAFSMKIDYATCEPASEAAGQERFDCRLDVLADIGALRAVSDVYQGDYVSGGPNGRYGLFHQKWDVNVTSDGCWEATKTKEIIGGAPAVPKTLRACDL